MDAIRLAILTVSDGVAAGTRADGSGAAIRAWAEAHGCSVVAHRAVPDETTAITAALVALADGMPPRGADSGAAAAEPGAAVAHAAPGAVRPNLVLTTGGTGFTPRDVTPEATRAVLEREAPGLAEAIRARGAVHTPYAWLSRGMAGMRGRTLIINLPGSESGVRDALAVLEPLLPHAVQLLRALDTGSHPAADV